MIEHLLQPLVCERFLTDARYREGHLRVVNALPERRVMGLHSPEIKQIAKSLSREGDEVVMPDGTHRFCVNGVEVIRAFEAVPSEYLCYEETVIWGYLINLEKCSLDERLAMLGRYVPVLDIWGGVRLLLRSRKVDGSCRQCGFVGGFGALVSLRA